MLLANWRLAALQLAVLLFLCDSLFQLLPLSLSLSLSDSTPVSLSLSPPSPSASPSSLLARAARETDRDRDRESEIQRRQRVTERQRQREREADRQKERDGDGETVRETDSERDREPESVFEALLGESLLAWGVDVSSTNSRTPFLYEARTADLLASTTASTSPGGGGGLVVALYFSASWCGPCRQFTPQLVAFYEEMQRQGRAFEVVLVSGDSDAQAFQRYFRQMPWLAVTLSNKDRVAQVLGARFNVQGIPHLVVLDGRDASVLTLDGRAKVLGDPYGLEFPWRPRSLWNLVPRPIRSIVNEHVFRLKSRVKHIVVKALKGLIPKSMWRLISR